MPRQLKEEPEAKNVWIYCATLTNSDHAVLSEKNPTQEITISLRSHRRFTAEVLAAGMSG